MKHVLLTFFGIILFYSLVFNDKESVSPAEKMNYIHENSSPNLYFMSDSSFKNINFVMPNEVILFVSYIHH
jgi:hypothetical protein